MAVHFSADELAARRAATCAELARRDLDGLLIFRQETMYYLTGYDTFGYVFFQCLYLGVDGTLTLVTRAPDLRQAQNTSMINDIRIWVDRDGATPADELRDVLEGHGLKSKRLGIEYNAIGLTAYLGKQVDAALDGFCELADASDLVTHQRMVKSESEIAYVRRAAELADDALDEAIAIARPGASESDILAGMQGAVFRGGGDYPGNPFIIGSDADALLCRTKSGRRDLSDSDQLNLEWAGTYRQYHAAMFRTMLFGDRPDQQLRMYDVAREALLAVEETLTPGHTIGDAFKAHADTIDKAGMKAFRMNACGYSLGTTYAPCWMDSPMMYADNPVEVVPGMIMFCHMILFDSDNTLAMCLGETILTTEGSAERLSRASLDLIHLI